MNRLIFTIRAETHLLISTISITIRLFSMLNDNEEKKSQIFCNYKIYIKKNEIKILFICICTILI